MLINFKSGKLILTPETIMEGVDIMVNLGEIDQKEVNGKRQLKNVADYQIYRKPDETIEITVKEKQPSYN